MVDYHSRSGTNLGAQEVWLLSVTGSQLLCLPRLSLWRAFASSFLLLPAASPHRPRAKRPISQVAGTVALAALLDLQPVPVSREGAKPRRQKHWSISASMYLVLHPGLELEGLWLSAAASSASTCLTRRAAGARVASRRARACPGQHPDGHLQVIPLFFGGRCIHSLGLLKSIQLLLELIRELLTYALCH